MPYSLIGLINSGLSHLVDVKSKSHLVIALIYGLGANLTLESREAFAKHVNKSFSFQTKMFEKLNFTK